MNYKIKTYLFIIISIMLSSINALDQATIKKYKEQNPEKASQISFYARLIEQREQRLNDLLAQSPYDENLVQSYIEEIQKLYNHLDELAYPEMGGWEHL